jgi:hypothetical protein
MPELNVLDQTGDTTIGWDPSRPDEVDAARETFRKLKAKGYLAYRTEGKDKGEAIREFDPRAERIVMSPPLAGG